MFSVKMLGLSQAIKASGRLSGQTAKAIQKSIKESASALERGAKKALTVGETRAILTGRLRSDTIVRQITPTMASVAPLVNYAIYVHEGTQNMRPRPFLEKAISITRAEIKGIFERNIKGSLRLK